MSYFHHIFHIVFICLRFVWALLTATSHCVLFFCNDLMAWLPALHLNEPNWNLVKIGAAFEWKPDLCKATHYTNAILTCVHALGYWETGLRVSYFPALIGINLETRQFYHILWAGRHIPVASIHWLLLYYFIVTTDTTLHDTATACAM